MSAADNSGSIPSGSSGEPVASPVPSASQDPPTPGRVRRAFSGSRELIRIAYRDPEHLSERLTLYTSRRLGDGSREWADSALTTRPDLHPAQVAEELRSQSANVARIDGAVAGTPFFIALVPGYLNYLVQEMRMTLRTAALYGRDPNDLHTSAEMLALRGVHPDVGAAEAALLAVRDSGTPPRPQKRRSLRTWVHSVYLLLVFGGFMSPSTTTKDTGRLGKVKATLSVLAGVAIWLTTWVFPVTFMIAMAWGCESHARQLGRRTLLFYDGDATSILDAIKLADQREDRGHDKRAIIRTLGLFLSIAIPIGFIAYVDHVRNQVGVNGLGALGALVALSLVIATAVISSRR
jgi:hypothetical protein